MALANHKPLFSITTKSESKNFRIKFLRFFVPKTAKPLALLLLLTTPLISVAEIFEAESASLSGAKIDATKDRPFSGSGFANFTALEGGSIEWLIPIASAGNYRLSFQYQLASGSRPLAFSVNNSVLNPAADFPATGSWASWGSQSFEVSLPAGLNTIRLSTTGFEGPNIDYLNLQSLAPSYFYEAEDGVLQGAIIDRGNDRPFSGRGFLNFESYSNGTARWDVIVEEEGLYDILWHYQLASGSRPLALTVNNAVVESNLTFPANGSWAQWADIPTRVHLNAGVNTVQLATTGSEGPNIDYLQLLPAVEPDFNRIRINFSDATTPAPGDWLKDSGDAFGFRSSGLEYGWIADANGAPASTRSFARNRPPAIDVNVWRETFIHMNHPNSNATFTWEISLPNDDYFVTVQVGDSNDEGERRSEHQLIIEDEYRTPTFVRTFETFGVRTVAFNNAQSPVTVTDGRLSLSTLAGSNTKIGYVVIERASPEPSIERRLTPFVAGFTPRDGATGVSVNTTISANFVDNLNPDEGGQTGIADDSITPETVALFEVTSTGTVSVPILLNTTGGSDAINLTTSAALKPNTRYRVVMNGVTDSSGEPVIPFSSEFITGDASSGNDPRLDTLAFERIDLDISGIITSIAIGPDNRLYALEFSGEIRRWDIAEDGSLINLVTINTLPETYPEGLVAVGFTISPDSTAENIIAYVTHATPFSNIGGALYGEPWGGKLSRLSGPLLQEATLLLTNLPRSSKDHLSNSIAFRAGEPNALYFNQGSNSAAGDADSNWGNRPERLLSAATLRLDLGLLPESLPLDVRTTDNLAIINEEDRTLARFSDGSYNPYSPDAPLTLVATGIRNAFDLVWHSNGKLYIPNNGTAGGGTSPASAATRRPDGSIVEWETPLPRITKHDVQPDWLLMVNPEETLRNLSLPYFGHPNPLRGEYVLNRGYLDSRKIPSSVPLDPNFKAPTFDFGFNKSPNGVIEYQNTTAHDGVLAGALLVTRYSNNNDVMILVPDMQTGEIVSTKVGTPGLTGFNDPLDIVEDTRNGNLYITDMHHPMARPGQLLLLRPSE